MSVLGCNGFRPRTRSSYLGWLELGLLALLASCAVTGHRVGDAGARPDRSHSGGNGDGSDSGGYRDAAGMGHAGPDASVTDAGPDASVKEAGAEASVTDAGLSQDSGGQSPDASQPPPGCGVNAGSITQLADRQEAHQGAVDAFLEVPAGSVITGVGLRVDQGAVATLRVRSQPVLGKGELGPPVELRAGVDSSAGLERSIDLPGCHVLVGIGARTSQDISSALFLWGAPLQSDGSLGTPKLFSGGQHVDKGPELQFMAPSGKVITGVGFGSDSSNITGLRVFTDGWQVL